MKIGDRGSGRAGLQAARGGGGGRGGRNTVGRRQNSITCPTGSSTGRSARSAGSRRAGELVRSDDQYDQCAEDGQLLGLRPNASGHPLLHSAGLLDSATVFDSAGATAGGAGCSRTKASIFIL